MPDPQVTDLVASIARALVDEPDQVSVDQFTSDGGATVVELKVARNDVGKVIGKSGRTAEAIRVVLASAATKLGRRVHLDILD